jgi:hypothetical protein
MSPTQRRRRYKRQSSARRSQPNPDEDIFLQPWYMPKPVSLQMRKILPSVHLAKMRYYFDDHGCLRCERRDLLYGSNGMCENCSVIVRHRLANCLNKRLRNVGVMENFSHTLSDCVSSAREIIGDRRIRKDK